MNSLAIEGIGAVAGALGTIGFAPRVVRTSVAARPAI